jgi:hypothetical protein
MSYYFTSATLFEADGDTVKAVLSNAYSKTWLDERDGDGSFEVSLPYEDSLIAVPGDIVKLSYGLTSNSYVFAGIVENVSYNLAGSNGGEDREARIGGRGVRALLGNAVVYPLGTSGKRSFDDDTAGKIMRDLVEEAQARGTLTELTLGFSDTNDSNGSPFSKTISIDESVGTSLLEVANRHVELAVDVYISPDLELRYYNNRGTDTTATLTPVTFRIGDTVSELSKEYSGPVLNTILVEYGNKKYKTENDAGSVSTYGRRETFLSVPNVTTETQVTLSTQQLLATTAAPNEGVTLSLQATDLRPYEDYNIGDYVYVVDHTGVRTKYRVSSLSISEDDAGNVSIVPELGTLRSDLTRRLNRALARLEASNAYGNSVNSSLAGSVTTAGEIVLLPGGVIQPAIVNVPAGYPLNLTEIVEDIFSLDSRNVLWDVRDLSSIGYYPRTLVLTSTINTGYYFVNLDNTTQSVRFATSAPRFGSSYKLIGDTYYAFTQGVQQWTGSSWVNVIQPHTRGRSWQVGTTWYCFGTRPGIDTRMALLAFDETTELVTKVLEAPGTLTTFGASGSIVGNGYAWIYGSAIGSPTPYYVSLATPTSWTQLSGTGFTFNASELGMDTDGNLLGYNYNGASAQQMHMLDRSGVLSITTNPLVFLQDIVAGGGDILAVSDTTTYASYGTSIGTRSGWVLVSVLYRTTGGLTPSPRLSGIFAVGPYGYTPIVYESTEDYLVKSKPSPWGYQSFEGLSWVADTDEGSLRGALFMEDNPTSTPPYTTGYNAFEWSLPVITP